MEFDLPSQIDGSDDQATLDWFSDIYSGNVYQWVSIYKIFWSSLYKDEQLADLPAYLALVSSPRANFWWFTFRPFDFD